MEEKKPKRPRIGAISAPSENSENQENFYQSRPYKAQERPDFQQRGFQPRPRPNYQNNYSSNYHNREDGNSYSRPQRTDGYQQRQNSYGNRPYRQNNSSDEGGYQAGRQNGYNRQQGQNGYNRQGGGFGRQNGGHNDYQQRSNGGYNRQQGQNGYNRQGNQGGYGRQNQGGFQKRQGFQKNQKPGMKFTPRPRQIDYVLDDIDLNEPIRLNKYMANSGICSRREADEKIQNGLVTVNDIVVTELGTKINRDDVVKCEDKVVTPERKCYVLLNKPKDCVTTSDDPNGRLTVLDVVKGACKERIYPVGRLDRNTTGVLLLTNDGELASKLTHPKFVKKKIYHVWTDKDITEEDMQRIADGIELEDGEIHADAISYANENDRNQAGIEIHSGRNRIVRRIFEHLGYRVTKLDRVYFAGLTKKNLPRGRWRYLTQEEVNFLRMGSFE
ncbi:MAG: pseudouridine synthase [Muribaculaceae bacterium]|nr:pseudouridine synthase [Muribaculaceae bacterium]